MIEIESKINKVMIFLDKNWNVDFLSQWNAVWQIIIGWSKLRMPHKLIQFDKEFKLLKVESLVLTVLNLNSNSIISIWFVGVRSHSLQATPSTK